ncbi:MAG: serine hydrolase [Clostridiales bacterium]|nr:serine hydrolase [Clostridiales bacterium]
MKHHDRSGYNIYPTTRKRRNNNNRRTIFVISCLLICLLCVILSIVFIVRLVSKSNKDTTTSVTTAENVLVSDDPGNVASLPVDDDPDPSSSSESGTARVQTVDAATREANLAALEQQVADYLNQQDGRFGVYYLNMNNGECLGFKENQPIVAASTIKIAYNTYLYERIASGEISLDEKMTYNAAAYPTGDYEGGTGTIQNSADGTEYTLREVSNLCITISDNCATNMILRRLGGEDSVNENYLKPISCVVDYRGTYSYTDCTGTEKSGKRRTSAIDLAKYTEHLYRDYKGNQAVFQPLIDDLCTTEYNWGLPAGVPSDVSVAHKVGFYPTYYTYNDVGIVFASEDYVLCVLTECGDEETAHQIIGEVSRMIYAYVESNYA